MASGSVVPVVGTSYAEVGLRVVVAESLGDALCATAQLFAAEDEESSPQDHMWIAALLKWVSLDASSSYFLC